MNLHGGLVAEKQRQAKGPQEPSKGQQATMPLPSAEERLQRLVEALQGLCKYPEIPAHRILQEIEKISGTK